MIITIDGPVASGKSTMARLLAQRLGFYYINSGMLFRALAYLLTSRYGYTPQTLEKATGKELVALAEQHDLSYYYDDVAHIIIDGIDVTMHLKNVEIDRAASIVSVYRAVREKVLLMQRVIARDHDCVVEGRDAGTVVFPAAQIHIFLTAPLDVRAKRWRNDQQKKGVEVSFEQAVHEVAVRDDRDSARACAPLCVPDKATIIDAQERSIIEVLEELVRICEGK